MSPPVWALLVLSVPAVAEAQRVTVYGFQQYSAAAHVNAEGTNVPGRSPDQAVPVDISLTRDVRFGAALTIAVTERVSAEFMWIRYALEAQVGDGSSRTSLPLDLTASHYLGHVVYRVHHRKMFSTFVYGGMGMTRLNSSVTGQEHHIVASGGAGIKGPIRQRFGWRIQGRVSPMPAAQSPGRTVFGRGNTGAYNVEPTRGALVGELYAGMTTTF